MLVTRDRRAFLGQRCFAAERLLASEWRSATDLATTTPFAFIHGPLPMRSRAFTAGCPAAGRGAQIRAPRAIPCASGRCERLTTAYRRRRVHRDSPVARSSARDEKTHLILLCMVA